MSARDIASERQRDRDARELELLRELRMRVLALGAVLRKANTVQKLTRDEQALVSLAFDAEGMGPHPTLDPACIWDLVKVAKESQS